MQHTMVSSVPGRLATFGVLIIANADLGAIRGGVGGLAGFYKDAHLGSFVVENVSMALEIDGNNELPVRHLLILLTARAPWERARTIYQARVRLPSWQTTENSAISARGI